jgi:hypothetical protein
MTKTETPSTMASKENDKLKLLLKKLQLPSPSHQFTKEVMREIEELTRKDVFVDSRIKMLLKDHALAIPPEHFTAKVMAKVRDLETSSVAHKPVISHQAWAVIGSFMLFFLLAALAVNQQTPLHEDRLHFISVGSYLNAGLTKHMEIIFYGTIVIFTATLLLTLEHWLQRKIAR